MTSATVDQAITTTGTQAPSRPAMERLASIDVLRGLVMILMALDHTRDFFGIPGVNPTDPTSTGLFLTRWVTHICAPVFFLLTGTSAFLSSRRWPGRDLSRYLLTRGAWLVLLEVTVLRVLSYQFNVDYQFTMLLVIWALGWSMIVLALLVRLPLPAILAFGLALIVGHNLFDGIRSTNPMWVILHQPGFVMQGDVTVFAAYPLIPWIGVTAVGYALGAMYTWESTRRRRALLWIGAGVVAAFVALRALNVYGDPSRWSAQETTIATVLSFVNATKYPPSLLFLLMTLGPALLILRAIDQHVPVFLRPATIYGRTPLFYYLAHFSLVHLAAVVVSLVRYGSAHWFHESPSVMQYPFTPPPEWGYSLPVVYLVWIGVVAALFPVCHWFARLKAQRGGILRYL